MAEEESEEHAKKSEGPVTKEVTVDLSDEPSTGAGEQAGEKEDEETLEDIADNSIREADTFSESQFAGSGSAKMPSSTLSSNSSPSSDSGTSSNLEQSAASSIGESPGRRAETSESASSAAYSSAPSSNPYQEYLGKSYAGRNYESSEKETRERIRKEEFAQGTALPKAPIVQTRWDDTAGQSRDSNWERSHETDARDYMREAIAKKENKRRRID